MVVLRVVSLNVIQVLPTYIGEWFGGFMCFWNLWIGILLASRNRITFHVQYYALVHHN
jgi:hypothetical protein